MYTHKIDQIYTYFIMNTFGYFILIYFLKSNPKKKKVKHIIIFLFVPFLK